MSRRDYEKYRCHAYDLIMTVGEELQQRVQAWDPQREILLVPNALYDSEFFPPKPKSLVFPQQWLAIGTPHVQKGWADLIDALSLLQSEGLLPPLCIDFTGDEPNPAQNDLGLHRLVQTQTRFLGRVEDFPGLVRRYDLVINPSRQESFGMAAIETLAAGVPLLSSRTGVIEQVQPFPYLLFAPADPGDLARALKHLIRHWEQLDIDVKRCQERIRQRFSIDRSVEQLCCAYARVLDA